MGPVRGFADEPAWEGPRDQRALPLPDGQLQHRQLPRRAHLGALRARPARRGCALRQRAERLRPLCPAAVRVGTVPDNVLPQQRRGPRPVPLVLPVSAGAVSVPRPGSGVPRVWHLPRHGHARGHPRQRARGHELCDGCPAAAAGAGQDLWPLHRHCSSAALGGKVQGGRRDPRHALPQRQGPLPRQGRPAVAVGGRVVPER
mmetsp:Transcript_81948/g.254380  ORF Transcript_81948/g.254380 Transcript_81948/m.254380 type:complete len:202 (+) Transcript_81948:176-781(+)